MTSIPSRRTNMSNALKQLVKEVIWATVYRHKPDPSHPTIAIFSSRRGGSTLMMELIAANKGFSFSDQPFGLYTMTCAQLNALPVFAYSQIIAPDPKEWAQIKEYIGAILSGALTVNGPWKFWKTPHSIRSDRMVLKITDAKSIAPELVAHFGLTPVVMTRHPISQSLSVQKNGWDTTARAFLRNKDFVATYLTPELEARAWDLVHDADPMKGRLLDWTLENLPLIAALKENPDWLYLPYETLIAHPDASITRLAQACQLDDPAAMLAQLEYPSRSTKRSSSKTTRKQISAGEHSYILARWRKQVDAEAEAALLAIPAQFGLPLYHVGEDEPRWPQETPA